jgi:uncharacterized membrane protein YphA (DoxX/SURF4 family)
MRTTFVARLTATDAFISTALIRWLVGAVFLSEGIQKWLDPAARGAGRFAKIGLPWPEFLGGLVGTFEILCGALLLVGLLVRGAVLPLLVIMAVALATTKWPILVHDGFWEMAHAARTDFAMTIGSAFILIRGAGRWSADRLLAGTA